MSPISNVIVPATGGPIWLQHIDDGVIVLEHDLVQIVGEALEKAFDSME